MLPAWREASRAPTWERMGRTRGVGLTLVER